MTDSQYNVIVVGGGIVERNEIHPSLNPVIVRSKFVIVGIVAKSLGVNRWRVEPISKLLQIVCSRFRGNEFVVADCQIYGNVGKRIHLLGMKSCHSIL